MKKILLYGFLFLQSLILVAQTDSEEKHLAVLFELMNSESDLNTRLMYHDSIKSELRILLSKESSFNHPLLRVEKLGKVYSNDGCVRVYSWNVEKENGTHDFGCFVQRKTKKSFDVYELQTNHYTSYKPEENKELKSDEWYGALYYKVIGLKKKKNVKYVVLGMNPYSELTRLKFIDIFDFTSGKITLGDRLFDEGKVVKYRKVFEHGSKYQMSLDYVSTNNRIIFDNLAPSHPRYEHIYTEYGPDFSYNAFVVKKGKLIYEDDVDARNAN